MSESIVLTVTGMKCGGCESNAKTQLEALKGVISATPNHKEKQIEIEFEAKITTVEEISTVIKTAGYQVED